MPSKSIRATFVFVIVASLGFVFSQVLAFPESDQMPSAVVYSQPPNPNGGLYQSSWWSPDESSYDMYVWDNFTLDTAQGITDVQWMGGYDPARGGSGGPVSDFTIAFYSSTAGDTQPDIVNPPLVHYQTGGNADETPAGQFGGVMMYNYTFTLPAPFQAEAGTRYWVYIVSPQPNIPDWGITKGTGGDGLHFRRFHQDGDVYQIASGDGVFTLLANSTSSPTPTSTNTPTRTPTNTPTPTSTNTPTPTSTTTPPQGGYRLDLPLVTKK